VYWTNVPGSSYTWFDEDKFSISIDVPYTPVGNPTDLTISVDTNPTPDKDEQGSNLAYYWSEIALAFKAPAGGFENPVVGYRFWYKDQDD
jgi:hypothetical protein